MLTVMMLSAFVWQQPPAPAVDVSVVYEASQLVVTAHALNGRKVKAMSCSHFRSEPPAATSLAPTRSSCRNR
jgi:hypothetical protein